MFQPHSELATPDDSTVIWRYMDFPKFMYLLSYSSLYFARANTFDDRWEGWYPIMHVPKGMNGDAEEEIKNATYAILAGDHEDARASTFINCWHMGTHESAAMWKTYTLLGQGIAIRSTVGRLRTALARAPEDIFIGEVVYGDFINPNLMQRPNWLKVFCVKRPEFSHEREMRALVYGPNPQNRQLQIAIDVKELLEAVVLAPGYSERWSELVQSLMEKCDLQSVPVESSSMEHQHPFHEGVALWTMQRERIKAFDTAIEACEKFFGDSNQRDKFLKVLRVCQRAERAARNQFGAERVEALAALRAEAESILGGPAAH